MNFTIINLSLLFMIGAIIVLTMSYIIEKLTKGKWQVIWKGE